MLCARIAYATHSSSTAERQRISFAAEITVIPPYLSFYKEIMAAKNDSYHYKFRLILIGNSGVGKSCILTRLKKGPNADFRMDFVATVGTDFYTEDVQVEDKTIKIQLWDTGGQERFRAIVRSYYRNVVGGFLVFDVTDRTSFDELNKWLEDAKEGAHPREPTFVLVGNKIDDEKNPRVVSQQEAKQFAQRLGMDYIETSAKTGQNVDELLPFLASKVYWKLRVKDIVPEEGWLGVSEGGLCTLKPSLYRQDSGSSASSNSRRKCCNYS